MERKLGILADCLSGVKPAMALDLIAGAGFETVFTNEHNVCELDRIRNKCDTLGLRLEFVHAPFRGINKMWLNSDEYQEILGGIRESVYSCHDCGVGVVVCHISSGWNAPQINDLGLSRFDELVDLAVKKNVVIAFENLRKVGNIAYFKDRYEGVEQVRFCYDCGHEHCYTVHVPFVDIFADKLVCTHLHDNFGRDETATADGDLHLLPFDGNIDYKKIIAKLDEYDYRGSLMLEVVDDRKKEYLEWGHEKFLQEAFDRAKKLNSYSTK
jgi:sugar phosphate isomerase/epimerase